MNAKENPRAEGAAEGAKGLVSTSYRNDSADVPGVQRQRLIAAYIEAGFALVPIPRGAKGPRTAGWNRPEAALTTIEAALKMTGNIGLLHAYSDPPTCALDIDDIEQARPWLAERGIDLDAALADPAAVRTVSPREGSAKVLYNLREPMRSVVVKGEGGKTILEFRCASKDGLSVQDVLPPSIHPSGQPYRLVCVFR